VSDIPIMHTAMIHNWQGCLSHANQRHAASITLNFRTLTIKPWQPLTN